MERPFRILGVQQIAVGALDNAPLKHLWVELLGATRVGHFHSEKENVDEEIVTLGRGLGHVEIDLMQPVDPEGRPRVHTPALNHVGLWVDDLESAYVWLGSQGLRFAPGGIRTGAAGYDVCFVHPKGSEAFPYGGGGVLIELVQAPKDMIDAYDAAGAE